MPLASFTLVRYRPAKAILGAAQMATQRPLLARVPGLRFARLLGTGSGIGFSAVPDLRSWALFAVWEGEEEWARFEAESRVMQQYRSRGEEVYTLLLAPVSAHGRWGGVEPFGTLPAHAAPGDGGPVVVLTRATIRPLRALRFWRRVPAVDETLRGSPDLLLSFGVGEVPWMKQATLSVWRSAAAMRGWAYRTPTHAEVVRRTRAESWYAEELFARFRLVASQGTFAGRDPLAGLIPSAGTAVSSS